MGKKKYNNVYVIGVFDLFHLGHLELLKRAKSIGKKLIVAVNGDELVGSYKRKPVFSEFERLELIKACKYVDESFIIHEYDNKRYLQEYAINAIIHGDDWEEESYKQQIRVTDDFLKQHEIELVLLSYTAGISTSELINKIKGHN